MGASFSLEDGENGERMEESASRLLIHSELTQEYKDATHAVIAECFDELVVTFGGGLLTKFTLNEEEFDLVRRRGVSTHFLIWETEDHHEDGAQDGPMANVFHVFCALFLLSQEELHSLDTKIDEIHTLFDFDKSGGLNRVELECLFQACVEGLARATGTKAPLNSATISSNADDMCDAYGITMDGSCEVSVSMLREWVAGREDIIAYLSEFTEAHTVVGYQRKVEEAFERVTASFVAEACAEAQGEPPEIDVDKLAKIVRELPGSPPTEEEIQTFIKLLDESGGSVEQDGMVSFDEFADAILPWISFGVVDDDGTGELSPDELKLLIWISGGDNTPEPSAQVVLQAMRGVDVNKDGVLVRLEWLCYNSGYDPATGAMKFSKAAKDMFAKMDADGSSEISAKEIKEIFAKEIGVALENMESEAHCCFSQSSRDALQVLMMNAGNEVADLIDEDHSGMIEWDEFYAHSATIAAKQEKIREYAKVLLVQDMRERPEARRPRASVMVRNPSSKSAKKSAGSSPSKAAGGRRASQRHIAMSKGH
ncbi:hypothetical protein SO694_00046255 [Aureococcus anophagefferens]|uniref:EF-hand domain-containing protein n=2 Tax=Aureococcus anophagefferens TaxID=44056 RepID=A0ABR1G7M7_AURAN